MCKFNILVSDDLTYATLRVENISIKHYQYEDKIIEELFNRFKFDLPSKVEFGSENYITLQLRKLVNGYGYDIDENGDVKPIEKQEICYTTLEKEVSESLSLFEIEVKDEYRYRELCEILLAEGYTISAIENNEKFIVSVY